jgi:hypothetical protein
MASAITKPVAEAHKTELTESATVLDYVQKIPLRAIGVQQLHTGMINFVYRLVLDQVIGETQQKTAILKYSAPYLASNPSQSFSPDRQIFETRALKCIPWKQFYYPSTLIDKEASLCSGVTLPEVYYDDPIHHVIVMQDCMTEPEEDWHPQATDSFRFFCDKIFESELKYRIARTIGSMLGSFTAQLHGWGRRADSHERAVELFGANNHATDLILGDLFTDFFKNVARTGYQLSKEQQTALPKTIQELDRFARAERDTVILDDFR